MRGGNPFKLPTISAYALVARVLARLSGHPPDEVGVVIAADLANVYYALHLALTEYKVVWTKGNGVVSILAGANPGTKYGPAWTWS